jgi:hypothetical protein
VQKTGAQCHRRFATSTAATLPGAAARPATAFMTGLTKAYVYAEGGTIDTNGNDITNRPAASGSHRNAASLSITGVRQRLHRCANGVDFRRRGLRRHGCRHYRCQRQHHRHHHDQPRHIHGGADDVTLRRRARHNHRRSAVIGTGANSGGGLTKIGGGVLTLSGATPTRARPPSITERLLLNNAPLSATAALTVNSGAALSLRDNLVNTDPVGSINLTDSHPLPGIEFDRRRQDHQFRRRTHQRQQHDQYHAGDRAKA